MDSRYLTLAENLVSHSTNLDAGEKLLIHAFDVPDDMVLALVRAARNRSAIPFVQVQHARLDRECILDGKEIQFSSALGWELQRMKEMDAYIALRGSSNVFENSDLPAEDMKRAMKILKPVLDWRVQETKWCVLRWPTPSMAQQAKMSSEAFENFYFNACCMDYKRMTQGMAALEARMRNADRVRIIGPNTDLRFSLKGIDAVACGGTQVNAHTLTSLLTEFGERFSKAELEKCLESLTGETQMDKLGLENEVISCREFAEEILGFTD